MRATSACLEARRPRRPRTAVTAIAVICLLLLALAGPAAATGGERHRHDNWRHHHRHGDDRAGHAYDADAAPVAREVTNETAGGAGSGGGEGSGGGQSAPQQAGAVAEDPTEGEPTDGGSTEESTEGEPTEGVLGTGTPGSEELLFYRRTAGQPIDGRPRGLGEYYDVAGTGGLSLINALDKWSVDHAEIVSLEIDGTDGDELLFYRPQPTGERGWGEFYDIGPNGGMTLIRRLESWSIDHAEIVALDIDGDGTDELVFYRRDPEGQGTGWGEIYDVTQHAGMRLLSRQTNWRTDHDMVIGVDVPSW